MQIKKENVVKPSLQILKCLFGFIQISVQT